MIPWGIHHVLIHQARRVQECPGHRRAGLLLAETDLGRGHRAWSISRTITKYCSEGVHLCFCVLVQLRVAVFLCVCMRVYLEAYILKKAVFLWLLCGCLSVAACLRSLYVFVKLCVCGCVFLWSMYVLKKLCVTCVSVAVWLRFSVCFHVCIWVVRSSLQTPQ